MERLFLFYQIVAVGYIAIVHLGHTATNINSEFTYVVFFD